MTIKELYEKKIISRKLYMTIVRAFADESWFSDKGKKMREKTYLIMYDYSKNQESPVRNGEITIEDVEILGIDIFKEIKSCGRKTIDELENLIISFA